MVKKIEGSPATYLLHPEELKILTEMRLMKIVNHTDQFANNLGNPKGAIRNNPDEIRLTLQSPEEEAIFDNNVSRADLPLKIIPSIDL